MRKRPLGGLLWGALIVLGAVLLAPWSSADVFWRKGANADAHLEELGGTRLYTTEIKINGYAGNLAVYGFTEAPTTLGSRLARALGTNMPRPQAGALLTHVQNQRLQRYMLLPSVATPDGCMVLALEQGQEDARRARQKPTLWPAGMPALDAEPLFSASCAKTRVTFVTAQSMLAPEVALHDAVSTFAKAGWYVTPPEGKSMQLLTSGRKQCIVFAGTAANGKHTTISILQREGASP